MYGSRRDIKGASVSLKREYRRRNQLEAFRKMNVLFVAALVVSLAVTFAGEYFVSYRMLQVLRFKGLHILVKRCITQAVRLFSPDLWVATSYRNHVHYTLMRTGYIKYTGYTLGMVTFLSILFSEEKCSFRGKGNTCNAQIRKFGETSPSPYTAPCNTGLVLVEVNGTDDECRHQFTAKVTGSCGLAEVWFKFGKEPGVSESEYPHEIKIKKTATGDFKVTIDGHVSYTSSGVSKVKHGRGMF